MKVLVLSGDNHRFADCAAVIYDFLATDANMSVELTEDKEVLGSSHLDDFDVCVFGTGFTRQIRHPDNSVSWQAELSSKQEDGLFKFVGGGKGLVGVHGTGWKIGGRAVDLIGGHANWHPPGGTFTVHIDDSSHPVTQGMEDFEVDDEIYICAYDPYLHILATAEWSNQNHPMAWVKTHGEGRVFYSTLGHGPETFRRPTMQTLIKQGLTWAGNS